MFFSGKGLRFSFQERDCDFLFRKRVEIIFRKRVEIFFSGRGL